MPIDLRWHVRGRVLIVQPHGEITMDDIQHYNQELSTRLAERTGKVHILAITKKTRLQAAPLKNVVDSLGVYRAEGIGWNVIVGDRSVLAKFFASTLGHVYKLRVAWADSFTEAVDILQHEDQTLIDLPLDFTWD